MMLKSFIMETVSSSEISGFKSHIINNSEVMVGLWGMNGAPGLILVGMELFADTKVG